MAKYIKREMPDIRGDNETRAYYKLKCVGLIDSEALIDYMSAPGSGLSKSMVRAVLAQLTSISSDFLAMGYHVSIEGLGQLSAKIGTKEGLEVEGLDDGSTKRKASSLEVTGVNFRVSKDFVKDINSRCELKRGGTERLQKSPYTAEQRLQMLKDYLEKNASIATREYAHMVKLTKSSAYRELEQLVANPSSGIATEGRKHYKVYVLENR